MGDVARKGEEATMTVERILTCVAFGALGGLLTSLTFCAVMRWMRRNGGQR